MFLSEVKKVLSFCKFFFFSFCKKKRPQSYQGIFLIKKYNWGKSPTCSCEELQPFKNWTGLNQDFHSFHWGALQLKKMPLLTP